jgi:DNA-binding MarR family transcriptional regulator
MILDLIEKDANITQREISKAIGVAVSMINSYLNIYEKKGLIKRKKHSTKTVEYIMTKKGAERRKLLNINYLHNSQIIYDNAKSNIKLFIEDLYLRKIKKLVIYGAGDVASIILNVLMNENLLSKFELSIVDDDNTKVGKKFFGFKIKDFKELNSIVYDSVFLGSYTYREIMFEKAIKYGVPEKKIIKYFER